MAATQNMGAPAHPSAAELQYLPYPLPPGRPFIPYQAPQVSQTLSAAGSQRSNHPLNRADPFIHVSSIVVPGGIQGKHTYM